MTVLKDVAVGDGSVVGRGSVLTRSVPPASRAHGVPARVAPFPKGVFWARDFSEQRVREGYLLLLQGRVPEP